MSWKDAKNEATALLQRLALPADLHGQEMDLTALTHDVPHKGRFREMIVRAVARQLKARGAKIKK